MNFYDFTPEVQTLLLTLATFLMTTLGSSMVFFVKKTNEKLINFLLSFSAGIMIASAIFSLIIPSIEKSEPIGGVWFLIPTVGLLLGGVFVVVGDIILNKFLLGKKKKVANNRSSLMFFAITLHNIPEGMCIGVAVAGAFYGNTVTLTSAIMLALGIAIQNIPEGASISLPLLTDYSKKKSFFYGMMSGIVEPIFGVLACLGAMLISNILPFLLAFSAGAMICVSCTELISEACNYNKNLASAGLLIGFFVMMILDLAL